MTQHYRRMEDTVNGIEQLIETARNQPECFKCGEPITEFNEVRIITVRVDGETKSVWAHDDHAQPDT